MLRYTANKLPIVNLSQETLSQVINLEFTNVQNAMNTAGGHKVAARTITASDTVASTGWDGLWRYDQRGGRRHVALCQ